MESRNRRQKVLTNDTDINNLLYTENVKNNNNDDDDDLNLPSFARETPNINSNAFSSSASSTSARQNLTKIPLITIILTFACQTPTDPLVFANVHSSWDETVRDYAAVSFVWNRFFLLNSSLQDKNAPSSVTEDVVTGRAAFEEIYADEIISSFKKYLIPIIKAKSTLHWYLEKIFDAGIDLELLLMHPLQQHGHALHIAIQYANMQAIDFISDVILNKWHNQVRAKKIFDFPSSVENKLASELPTPLAMTLNRLRPNAFAFAKLLRFMPEYIDINRSCSQYTSTAGVVMSNFPLWQICDRNFVAHAEHLFPLAQQVGLDLNQKNQGVPAIFIACQDGHHQLLEMLLNSFPGDELDVNSRDSSLGMSCLYIASGKIRFKCVELLLNDKRTDKSLVTNLNASPLHIAAQECKDRSDNLQDGLKIIKLLIDHGFDLNARHSTNGFTPLAAAVAKGNEAACELLINSGASLVWANNVHSDLASLARANDHSHIIHKFMKDSRTFGEKVKGFMSSLW